MRNAGTRVRVDLVVVTASSICQYASWFIVIRAWSLESNLERTLMHELGRCGASQCPRRVFEPLEAAQPKLGVRVERRLFVNSWWKLGPRKRRCYNVRGSRIHHGAHASVTPLSMRARRLDEGRGSPPALLPLLTGYGAAAVPLMWTATCYRARRIEGSSPF